MRFWPTLLLPALSSLLLACPSGTIEAPDASADDGGLPGSDARADATPAVDSGPGTDGGPDLDAAAGDAVAGDAATGTDATPLGDGGGCGVSQGDRFDGIWVGRLNANVYFNPTSSSSVALPFRPEVGDFVAAGIARFEQSSGLVWSAQITLGTRFDNLRFTQLARRDPADGATFLVAAAQPNNATYLRFYHADGTLARELLPGGSGPNNIIGRTRNTNHFLVKYTTTGSVAWVRRFGLNADVDADAEVATVMVNGARVRVSGRATGAPVTFGIGEPGEQTLNVPAGVLFWADFDAADGHYLPGSARYVRQVGGAQAGASYGAPTLTAHHAWSTTGELAITGSLGAGGGGSQWEVGNGGGGAITISSTKSMALFARIGADGAPVFARTATVVSTAGRVLDPDSIAIGASGWIVAGGRVGNSTEPYSFEGGGRFTLNRGAGFLVAYRPDGSFAWVKQIAGSSPYPTNSVLIDEADSAVYLSGSGSPDTVLGPGEPNELRMRMPYGWYLARFSLMTGELDWARVLGGASSGYAAWPAGGEILVPGSFSQVTVWGGATEISDSWSSALQALFRFSSSGDLLRCNAVTNSSALVQPF